MEKQLFLGNEPKKELMNEIKNHEGFIKAYGGLWTSSYVNGGSAWLDWCEDNNFYTHDNMNDKWLLTVNKNIKILKIDSFKDLDKVFDEYGYSLQGVIELINYERLAQDYDGMWLTDKGQMETRMTLPRSLYGWDCESTHWFRWVFDKVEKVDSINSNAFQQGLEFLFDNYDDTLRRLKDE